MKYNLGKPVNLDSSLRSGLGDSLEEDTKG